MNRLLPLLLLVLALGCKKEQEPLKDTPPLLLMPKQDGHRLSDQELDGISLHYFLNNEVRKPVPDFKRAGSSDYQRGLLQSYNVAELSAVENVKTFYLTYPSGQEDTFQIDYRFLSESEARKDPCFCDKRLQSISRQGVGLSQDGANKNGDPIYSFEK